MWLESKLAMGLELVRAISTDPVVRLADRLREVGYGVLELEGNGENGQHVEVLLVVEQRRRIPGLLSLVTLIDPTAICTLSDVKRVLDPFAITRRRDSWISRLKRK